MNPERPPWLNASWQRLVASAQNIPQSLMLIGPAGLGKFQLAFSLAKRLLCESDWGPEPCGQCPSCHGIDSAAHPDIHLVTSDKYAADLEEPAATLASRYLNSSDRKSTSSRAGQQIGVDQVRSLIERLGTHSGFGGERIAILAPANSMNANAANALLKILEEPPGLCRFILVCSNRSSLPATIFSRVSPFDISTPDYQQGLGWLESQGVPAQDRATLLALANAAPLAAYRLYQQGWAEQLGEWQSQLSALLSKRIDPVAMAANIGDGASDFLYWLERLLSDAVSLRFNREGRGLLLNRDEFGRLVVAKLYSDEVWDMIRKLQVYRQRQQRVVDEQLFLEESLIAIWQKI